jgi:hypothetical protein
MGPNQNRPTGNARRNQLLCNGNGREEKSEVNISMLEGEGFEAQKKRRRIKTCHQLMTLAQTIERTPTMQDDTILKKDISVKPLSLR